MTGDDARYDAYLGGELDDSRLARLLAAAQGPPCPEELNGLGPALAAFRTAAVKPGRHRQPVPRRWSAAKALAVAAGVSLAGGMTYSIATTGQLLGGSAPSSPKPHTTVSVPAAPGGTAIQLPAAPPGSRPHASPPPTAGPPPAGSAAPVEPPAGGSAPTTRPAHSTQPAPSRSSPGHGRRSRTHTPAPHPTGPPTSHGPRG